MRGHFLLEAWCLAIPLNQQGKPTFFYVASLSITIAGGKGSKTPKITDMDFRDSIKQLGERMVKLKDNIHTEEATKNAFVMPLVQILGYDVFNPLEVLPEHVCDIGTKKGEKIDYAIMRDGQPIMLIECKHWGQNLTLHDNQLLRYFGVSKAKFGILTNGILYKFYTDLESANIMDSTPFLEIDISDIKDAQIEELKKFHKSNFDENNIIGTAADLKYTNEFRALLQNEISSPSDAFVRVFAKQVFSGVITAKYIEYFSKLLKKSFNTLISDMINERLNAALKSEKAKEETEKQAIQEEDEAPEVNKIHTTNEELEGYYIVKSIAREVIDGSRITYKDTRSYFAVTIDNNVRKTLCRFYFDGATKWFMLIDEEKNEERNKISSLDDIYRFKETIIDTIKRLTV